MKKFHLTFLSQEEKQSKNKGIQGYNNDLLLLQFHNKIVMFLLTIV